MTQQKQAHSVEAEQHIVACAIVFDDMVPAVLEIPEEWFFHNSSKLIVRAVKDLANQGLGTDFFSLGEYLTQKQQLEMVGGMKYLSDLAESLPSASLLNSFKTVLFNAYKTREISAVLTEAVQRVANNGKPSEIVEFLQSGVIDLMTSHHSGGFKKLGLHLDEVLAEIEWRYDNPGKLLGMATGFAELDQTIDGFEPGKNYVIAGRPGSGKTAFAVNLAARLAEKDAGCYFSLEMTGKSLSKRLLTNKSRVHNSTLRSGQLESSDFAAIAAGVTLLHESKLHIDETPSLTTHQIRSRLKAFQIKHGGVSYVIIDHIGLIKKDPRKGDTEGMALIADELLGMAKEFNCPFILLAQINRGTEGRDNKRPMVSDLKQSGKIEENADVVMLLYREDYYNPSSPDRGITELNVGKNRDGEAKMIPFRHQMAIGDYQEAIDWEPAIKPQGKF